MRYRKTEIWKSVDWITILLYLIMVIAGWFSICGASYEFDNVGLFDPSGRPGMQMIWIGTSLALIFVILMLESDFFDIFAYLIYACVIVLLIATIFLAPNIKGSHSWLVLGPIRLQPAELAKFATALAVAKFMNGYGNDGQEFLNHFVLDLLADGLYSFTERDGVGIGLLGILPDVISGRNDWIYFVDRSLCGRLFRYGNEIFRGDGGYYPIG